MEAVGFQAGDLRRDVREGSGALVIDGEVQKAGLEGGAEVGEDEVLGDSAVGRRRRIRLISKI